MKLSENDSRKRKREIERRARDRSKRLKLNNEVIEWGDYNPDFPTSGTAGELELHDFLCRLERGSKFAETRTNATARLVQQLLAKSKLEILAELQVQLHHFPCDDVILLTYIDRSKSLKNALDQSVSRSCIGQRATLTLESRISWSILLPVEKHNRKIQDYKIEPSAVVVIIVRMGSKLKQWSTAERMFHGGCGKKRL